MAEEKDKKPSSESPTDIRHRNLTPPQRLADDQKSISKALQRNSLSGIEPPDMPVDPNMDLPPMPMEQTTLGPNTERVLKQMNQDEQNKGKPPPDAGDSTTNTFRRR